MEQQTNDTVDFTDPLLCELRELNHAMLRDGRVVREFGDLKDTAALVEDPDAPTDEAYFRMLWDMVDDLRDRLHDMGLELPDFFRDTHESVRSKQMRTRGYCRMIAAHVTPSSIIERRRRPDFGEGEMTAA